MKACPRYDKCSAPICPLDPDWRLRSHLPGERVCAWLLELSKAGGEQRIRACLREVTADQIVRVAPLIREHAGNPLRKALDQASRKGSKLEHHWKLARHLQKQCHGVESPRHAQESIEDGSAP